MSEWMHRRITRRVFIDRGTKLAAGFVMFGVPEQARGTLVFAHGYMGGPEGPFTESLAREMWDRHRVLSVFPSLPHGQLASGESQNGELPNLSASIDILDDMRKQAVPPVVLGGISFGAYVAACVASRPSRSASGLATAAMRYGSNEMPEDHPLKNIYKWGLLNQTNIRSNTRLWVAMHSKDDETVPFESAKRIKRDFGAVLEEDTNRGHYGNAEDGLLLARRIGRHLLAA